MIVGGYTQALVEYAEDTFKIIPGIFFQVWELHDDAVVCQAFDKWVRHSFTNLSVIIIQIVAAHIDDRLVQITDFMSKDINGDDWQTEASRSFLHDVLLI